MEILRLMGDFVAWPLFGAPDPGTPAGVLVSTQQPIRLSFDPDVVDGYSA